MLTGAPGVGKTYVRQYLKLIYPGAFSLMDTPSPSLIRHFLEHAFTVISPSGENLSFPMLIWETNLSIEALEDWFREDPIPVREICWIHLVPETCSIKVPEHIHLCVNDVTSDELVSGILPIVSKYCEYRENLSIVESNLPGVFARDNM